MALQVNITVLSGVSAGDVFRFQLDPGGGVVIGRAQECDLVLQDPTVSRRHAKVELKDKGFFLSDLGSTHGTVHMGFRLQPGDEHCRQLHDNDEFKVGEAIFRVNYDEELFAKPKQPEVLAPTGSMTGGKALTKPKIKPAVLAAGAVALLLLLYLLFGGDGGAGGLPQQLSEKTLSIPQARVIGYLSVGTEPGMSDRSHLDKAKFGLPASDVVIEYDYLSETDIDILIDTSRVELLKPNTALWQKHFLIYRDTAAGKERKLIFDNLSYPVPVGVPDTGYKKWAVQNIRATPLVVEIGSTVESALREAIGVADRLGKTTDGPYLFSRALQRAMLAYVKDGNLDAWDVEVQLDVPELESTVTKQKLERLIEERREGKTAEQTNKHLRALSTLAAAADSYLWRQFNLRTRLAEGAAKRTEYIEAHDELMTLLSMFPGEQDYRFRKADEMLKDNSVVPSKVRKNPDKFRRKARLDLR